MQVNRDPNTLQSFTLTTTALTTETISAIINVLLGLAAPFRCRSVQIYSPLNDGIYVNNTTAILVGGQQTGPGIGFPLVPGQIWTATVSSTESVYVYDAAGAQTLIVTISS